MVRGRAFIILLQRILWRWHRCGCYLHDSTPIDWHTLVPPAGHCPEGVLLTSYKNNVCLGFTGQMTSTKPAQDLHCSKMINVAQLSVVLTLWLIAVGKILCIWQHTYAHASIILLWFHCFCLFWQSIHRKLKWCPRHHYENELSRLQMLLCPQDILPSLFSNRLWTVFLFAILHFIYVFCIIELLNNILA